MTSSPAPPKEGIDFEALPWNLNVPEELSYVHIVTSSEWTNEHYDACNDTGSILTSVHKYSTKPLPFYPSTTSLNYGTTVWEGLKCYRTKEGKAVVFRPDRNHARFARGAEAMCLPVVPKALFMRGIMTVIQANAHLIPPEGAGMKLYLRPMLFGSGQQLGLHPSPEFSLLFFASPTGSYFSGPGLNLHLETKRCRAARGGVGSIKCSGNYAVALMPLMDCKKQGFHDNLFLELETYNGGALENAIVQEMSAANIFLVLKDGEIVTPCLERGTILPGVTRESVITLIDAFAKDLQPAMIECTGVENVTVRMTERDVSVGEFRNAMEAFCTGTAAELVPIARLATGDGEESFDVVLPFGKSNPGPVTARLLALLRSVMIGETTHECCECWLQDAFSSPSEFCK